MTRILAEPYAWYYVLGYAYALIVPSFFLPRISEFYFLIVASDAGVQELEKGRPLRNDLPFLVGLVERPLYVASILLGKPEFIGVWLALKVAGGWRGWDELILPKKPGGEPEVHIIGRHFFNSHLVGSGLSLIHSLIGAFLIQGLFAHRWQGPAWLAIITTALTALLWWWVKRERDKRSLVIRAA